MVRPYSYVRTINEVMNKELRCPGDVRRAGSAMATGQQESWIDARKTILYSEKVSGTVEDDHLPER